MNAFISDPEKRIIDMFLQNLVVGCKCKQIKVKKIYMFRMQMYISFNCKSGENFKKSKCVRGKRKNVDVYRLCTIERGNSFSPIAPLEIWRNYGSKYTKVYEKPNGKNHTINKLLVRNSQNRTTRV